MICYENSSHSPTMREVAKILYHLFIRLSQRWHVPVPLLVFNFELMMAAMYDLSIEDYVKKLPSLEFTIVDCKIALEFYLQMDVDCFYLKTCSFRGSKPRTLDYISHTEYEGIFCVDSPEACYGMKRCNKKKCLFCHLPNRTHRYEPALKFTDKQIHTFVNQYHCILNCDVTCSSSNVIYTLTCPCQQYDYIGRTSGAFYKRLTYHRLQYARIIRDFLLGQVLINRMARSSSSNKLNK